MATKRGSIFVDMDATLAHYDGWVGPEHIGKPVPLMLAQVKQFLEEGWDVRIFTARVFPLNMCVMPDTVFPATDNAEEAVQNAVAAVQAIQKWCELHIGQVLPVTNIKDYTMVLTLDDRARQVVENTGEIIDHKTHRRIS